ncbi:cilia- and flagella-associated protein 36-like isoform X2 [Limulus polyphemus]|uniref:Cilia- and flagella-associated protein 36 n=1 Tax=Limulus polyphemus TaxID=6850 RepID=A0ABM1AZZ2_LIMPO|nr:cilia- and flagella-associated protein 36-like isoform X2 [Limulus polyphemus]
MTEEDKANWVFDTLVKFLKGAVWNIPILTFIEQKSIVFEPEGGNEEEYKKIHQEYKNLVDYMLGSHMEDMKITPEQFEKACGSVGNNNVQGQFHQSLFEQVWAADDYEIFKRMMIQKNIELQLQALELLGQHYGINLEDSENIPSTTDEEEIMEEVMKKSLEEYKKEKEKEDQETKDLEQAIRETMLDKSRLEKEMGKEKELLDLAIKLSLSDVDSTNRNRTVYAIVEPPVIHQEKSSLAECDKNTSNGIGSTSGRTQPSIIHQDKSSYAEDVKTRQEYLRKQRDRLLALKRQEREKRLSDYEKISPNKRPKSSRAARSIVKQELQSFTIDPETLAFRKSLAACLKTEVIERQKAQVKA